MIHALSLLTVFTDRYLYPLFLIGRWVVENQIGKKDLVIDECDSKQSVYVFGCKDSVLQIQGLLRSLWRKISDLSFNLGWGTWVFPWLTPLTAGTLIPSFSFGRES